MIDWNWWSLIALFSALLSRLTSLAWGSTWVTSFIARFLNIHRSGVLTAVAWLVPHETAAVSAQILCTPYNHAPCHFMQSHIRNGVCVFSCNLPPALLAEWPGSFTCYCGNTGVERIPKWVSTECRPWRRKFSRCSSRDSNPRPFIHEFGSLTTELSPPPNKKWCRWNCDLRVINERKQSFSVIPKASP